MEGVNISIHALAKRATAVAHTGTVSDVDFNPRPRKEGDGTLSRASISACISIHALAKRATVVVLFKESHIVYFNPRPRKEGDIFNGN